MRSSVATPTGFAGGRFVLEGTTYQLTTNNGPHHLHGGIKGFDRAVWEAEPFRNAQGEGLALRHTSRDGDEGYPGRLSLEVRYLLTDRNELVVDYEAETDAPTPINLTQHSYFNLAGVGGGSAPGPGDILGHELMLAADSFTPVDGTLIPTGEIAPVEGTPFDFRRPTPIGARIGDKDRQLEYAGGYDHIFVIRGFSGEGGNRGLGGNRGFSGAGGGHGEGERLLVHAARVVEPRTGRTLDVSTTEPGLQLYTGNWLDGSNTGKGGRVYGRHTGFCLETQHFPVRRISRGFPRRFSGPVKCTGRARYLHSAGAEKCASPYYSHDPAGHAIPGMGAECYAG